MDFPYKEINNQSPIFHPYDDKKDQPIGICQLTKLETVARGLSLRGASVMGWWPGVIGSVNTVGHYK